jgi:DNA-binding transcriptional LysR family regulator
MHFVHRVRNIWSWLPAFRAVAEAEHLPTAAQELGIVPSSLSRTVKQIEDELGVPLFDRTSKALVLNQAGRTLVTAVREAMRIIDDAVGHAVGDDLVGNVGAVATGDLVHAVLIPASAALAVSHASLVLTAVAARADEASELLLRGEVDAAVSLLPTPAHPDLRMSELATWTRGAYVRRERLDTLDVRCVVVGTPTEPLDDGWPSDVERKVAAWAPDERSALELCARGDLVTVACDAIVHGCGFAERLRRLPSPPIAARTLYLTQRRAVGRHRRTEALVEAIRTAAEGVAAIV